MIRRTAVLVTAGIVLAACARSQPAPPPAPTVDPVGTYDFTTVADGTPVAGVITISRAQSGYSASVSTDATGDMSVTSVAVDGMTIMLRAEMDSPVELRMDFTTDDEFTGGWTYAGMAGTLAGKRRKS